MTLFAFLCYVILIFGIGYLASRRIKKTAEDVHLSGREHGTWTSALSASASTESGFVLLGMVGMGYAVGLNALWIVPAGMLGYWINWHLLGQKLRARSLQTGAITMPDLIRRSTGDTRISRIAAILASILAIIFLTAYTTAQFSAAGKALSTQFGTSHALGVMLGALLVIIYSGMGGFRAVAWSDNLQAAMMAFCLIVVPAIAIASAGGFGAVFDALRQIDPNLVDAFHGASGLGMIAATVPWLMLALAYPGQPHAIARLMAAKDTVRFGNAYGIAAVWFAVVYTGAVLLGMTARAAFSDLGGIGADPETALPVLAEHFLPAVIVGITVAAIIAAITSTADSTLLSAASTVTLDGVERTALKNRFDIVWLMRFTILILGGIAAWLALDEEGVVFHLVLYAWSGLGASLGPAVLYCALARRPQAPSALAGLVVGGTLAFVLHGYDYDLLIGFTGGAIAIGIMHYLVTTLNGSEE